MRDKNLKSTLNHLNLSFYGKGLGLIVLFLFLTACQSGPYLWVQDVSVAPPGEYGLAPGDIVSIQVLGHKNLSSEFTVRADGSLGLPLIGIVPAQGQSLVDLALAIQKSLNPVIESPEVHVSLISKAMINVGVIGEVKASGYFVVKSKQGILSVLAVAGGLTEYAHENRIFVVHAQAKTPRIRFRMSDLKRANTAASRFLLVDGDTIIVE